ncbi:MAG: hypothetical protein WBA97_32295 [Actinophytocola sp.]|uniref:hypothetical protein n=1 Tax=Actinophytocola sp. TaxID=1872138 RepID=UPI003C795E0D
MTWQEELRQLDSALAGGELAANEYRKRRDEILAAASSAQPPSSIIGPPTGPQPVVPPDGETQDDGENADVTQVVNVESAEAEQTQVIDAATMDGATAKAGGANGDVERTQVVTAEHVPMQAAPQQPMWATQFPDPSAPTGAFPLPPQQLPGPAVTPMDAQDLFTSNKPPRGDRKPWLIGVVVLVLLALAGGAVWLFAFSGDDEAPQEAADDGQQQTTSAEEPAPEPVDIMKIELPGEPGLNSGGMDISRASELKVIAPAEATLLAGAGADQLVHNGTTDGDYSYLLYSFQSEDAKAAEELTASIIDIQGQLGFKPTEIEGVPDTVDVSTVTNSEASGTRGVYTYGDTTILMFVLQIPAGDVDEMRVQFQRAMTAVTDAAPPAK